MTAAISNHTGSLANAQRYYSQHRKDADAVAANLLATPAAAGRSRSTRWLPSSAARVGDSVSSCLVHPGITSQPYMAC